MVGAPAEEVAEVAEDATDAVLLATELPTAEPLDDAELVTLALTLVKLARRELIDEAEAPVAVASSELYYGQSLHSLLGTCSRFLPQGGGLRSN